MQKNKPEKLQRCNRSRAKRPLTKNGQLRSKKIKATITERRLYLRGICWVPLKHALLNHLQTSPKGEAARMAHALGISRSQIHRFTCPDCEHNQEPSYSIGFALTLYLGYAKISPVIELQRCK